MKVFLKIAAIVIVTTIANVALLYVDVCSDAITGVKIAGQLGWTLGLIFIAQEDSQ